MNLQELSNAELLLLRQVEQVKGTMLEKPTMVDELGILDKYIEIHRAYADVAQGDDEALKRALFIQWFAFSEPSGLTGIPGGFGLFDGGKELEKEVETKVIQIVQDKVKDNQLDEELKWMLSYYGSWDYYFEQFSDTSHLKTFIGEGGYPIPENADLSRYENRGQLGYYWKSVLENNKKSFKC